MGIVVFVVRLLMLKFLILGLFLLIVPLIFVWLMAVTMVAALVARGATKGLPLGSALRS